MSEIIQQETQIANLEDYRAWEDVFKTWLSNYKSERTRRKYRSITQEFFAWVDKWFTDVTQRDVITWRDYLGNDRQHARRAKDGSTFYVDATLADASINLYLSAVSSFYAFALERGLVEENPVDGVSRHSVSPYGRATYLNVDKGEDLTLLKSIESDTLIGLRDRAIVLLLLTTAVRVGAAANAKVEDIANMNGQWYLMYRNKGGERQTALITEPVIKAIRRYLDARGNVTTNDPLFMTVIGGKIRKRGKPLGATAITNMISRRAERAGLHHITAHSLRHSAALQAIQHGSVGDVQKLLKHKSNRVTLVYIDHIEDDKADEMTKKLASRYGDA